MKRARRNLFRIAASESLNDLAERHIRILTTVPDIFHVLVAQLIEGMTERIAAPVEFEGFQLLNIPGLAYLHAEHATTGAPAIRCAPR